MKVWAWRLLTSRLINHYLTHILESSSPLFTFSSLQAMLHLLSMLVLLVRLPGNEGAEMKTLSQRSVANACTLVMCSPTENGLPGRDGRDGREGPRGEKGDPGRAGIRGSVWWVGGGARMGPNLRCSVMYLDMGFSLPWSDFPPGVQATCQTHVLLGWNMCFLPSLSQPDASLGISGFFLSQAWVNH